MRRRNFLAAAGLAAGFQAPAIATGVRKLSMVTDWPKGSGMLSSAQRLANSVSEASNGRLEIDLTPSGGLVRPFETFDAVQAGVADMFHSHIGYFEKKSPAFHFFSGVPFGLSAEELFSWVKFGGGQALFDELSGQFNIKAMLCCSTGSQMGGWFTKPIDSPESFEGLKYRMSGPGAEVLRRLGAVVVVVPGSEIVLALQSGAIDACEWVGPWMDMKMGLHNAAPYYYYPAWQEPGTALALGINQQIWAELADEDQRIIALAAESEYAVSLAEFNFNNARALQQIRQIQGVTVARFNESVLQRLSQVSTTVLEEIAADDALSKRIYTSHREFKSVIRDWTLIAYSGLS